MYAINLIQVQQISISRHQQDEIIGNAEADIPTLVNWPLLCFPSKLFADCVTRFGKISPLWLIFKVCSNNFEGFG